MAERAPSQRLDCQTDAVNSEGRVVFIFVVLSSAVVNAAQNVQAILLEVGDKEIKGIQQVKETLRNLISFAGIANAFLDKVAAMLYYCQSDSVAAVEEGLNSLPPNLDTVPDWLDLLDKLATEAINKHSELADAYKTARAHCSVAAEVCAHMARESQRKKRATRGIGGTAAGAALAGGTAAAAGGVVATGVAASAIAGVFTLGIGTIVGLGITAVTGTAVGAAGVAAGVATAVVTHCIASDYAKSEAAFRKICGDFDALLDFAYDLRGGVAQVHTTLEDAAAQVSNISYCVDRTNIALIKDSVKRLKTMCAASSDNISRSREDVRGKIEELRAKFRSVY